MILTCTVYSCVYARSGSAFGEALSSDQFGGTLSSSNAAARCGQGTKSICFGCLGTKQHVV